ncbi:MAG: adenosine deaminase [Anaerolineae bacterium]|nr:adenosine deaminase [Anaerolineae bacterium]
MTWFDLVSKVELHVHLEGSIPLDALWALIQKYGGDPSLPDRAALEARFQYRDFPHFIETWCWKNGFLRQYEDFTRIAEAVARDFVAQNIRYAEVFYSPSDFRQHGLQVQGLTEAIRAGLDRVSEVEIALIADLVRDNPPEQTLRILDQVNEVKSRGVIGIGIGGAEQNHPPEPFAPVYARARQLGLHTTAHAGEAAGAASIWGAIRALNVERIGHGTRAFEDETLLDTLAERRIPLEMCPLSNVRTNVVPDLDRHPIRRYWERGLVVTVNTDDPKMFGNSLAQEYAGLEQSLGFTRAEIRMLILQGIDASWLPDARKQQLKTEFQRDPAWTMDD